MFKYHNMYFLFHLDVLNKRSTYYFFLFVHSRCLNMDKQLTDRHTNANYVMNHFSDSCAESDSTSVYSYIIYNLGCV